MSKTVETYELERRVRFYTVGQIGCDEVRIGRDRVDFMTRDPEGTWRCFEIKISKHDFHSKASKTFVGHLNYFVMPHWLFEAVKDEIEPEIGVLVPNGFGDLKSVKIAKRQTLLVKEEILLNSLVLRLHKIYIEYKTTDDTLVIKQLQRQIEFLQNDLRNRTDKRKKDEYEADWMRSYLRHCGLEEDFEKWREHREAETPPTTKTEMPVEEDLTHFFETP